MSSTTLLRMRASLAPSPSAPQSMQANAEPYLHYAGGWLRQFDLRQKCSRPAPVGSSPADNKISAPAGARTKPDIGGERASMPASPHQIGGSPAGMGVSASSHSGPNMWPSLTPCGTTGSVFSGLVL